MKIQVPPQPPKILPEDSPIKKLKLNSPLNEEEIEEAISRECLYEYIGNKIYPEILEAYPDGREESKLNDDDVDEPLPLAITRMIIELDQQTLLRVVKDCDKLSNEAFVLSILLNEP